MLLTITTANVDECIYESVFKYRYYSDHVEWRYYFFVFYQFCELDA